MKDTDHVKGSMGRIATTEEYLVAVTIGKREPLDSTIYLAPYDPDWPSEFARHADRIRDAPSEKILLLEHVGSTSVPELFGETSRRYGSGGIQFCRRVILCPSTRGARLCAENS